MSNSFIKMVNEEELPEILKQKGSVPKEQLFNYLASTIKDQLTGQHIKTIQEIISALISNSNQTGFDEETFYLIQKTFGLTREEVTPLIGSVLNHISTFININRPSCIF